MFIFDNAMKNCNTKINDIFVLFEGGLFPLIRSGRDRTAVAQRWCPAGTGRVHSVVQVPVSGCESVTHLLAGCTAAARRPWVTERLRLTAGGGAQLPTGPDRMLCRRSRFSMSRRKSCRPRQQAQLTSHPDGNGYREEGQTACPPKWLC